MDQITEQDLAQIGEILSQILQNDNEARKAAESKLNEAKLAQTEKYAILMAAVMHPTSTQFSLEAKSLAAVILRRNISISSVDASDVSDQANNANLWLRISDDCKTELKTRILETINGTSDLGKKFTHKVCNVAVEI